jgi:hypothetical protein
VKEKTLIIQPGKKKKFVNSEKKTTLLFLIIKNALNSIIYAVSGMISVVFFFKFKHRIPITKKKNV